MKKIVIRLEYKCYPMWVYDNKSVDNDLVEELTNDKVIDDKLMDIQAKYDALFIDDGIEFSFRGFTDNKEKIMFQKLVNDAITYVKDKTGGKYIIENGINYDEL
ncbi:MAG TPA: hypothetical protein DC000_01330 [Clostridiales bacterium]|nr:hypothetical protein [Clostridiales bacterium]